MAADLVFALLDGAGPKGRAERSILLNLANRANKDHKDIPYYCCPGTKLLAEETGYSERYVITKLDELEADEWLRRVRHGKFFRYELAVDRILSTELSSVERLASTELSARSTELSAISTELSGETLKEGNSFETKKKPSPIFEKKKLTPVEIAETDKQLKDLERRVKLGIRPSWLTCRSKETA